MKNFLKRIFDSVINRNKCRRGNYKLFTHTDLDGVGCSILAMVAFDNVDVTYVNYDNVNKEIKEFIDNEDAFYHYDGIFITDISVNEEVSELIDDINKRYDNHKFILIDHHSSSKWINKYDWALSIEHTSIIKSDYNYNNKVDFSLFKECFQYAEDSNWTEKYELASKSSGTLLFYFYLKPLKCIKNYVNDLDTFVSLVTSYDTWKWVEDNNSKPKELNDLFGFLGRERFVNNILDKLLNNKDVLDNENSELISIIEEKEKRYIESHSRNILFTDYIEFNDKKIKLAVVFASQNVSMLGHHIADMYKDNPEIVGCAMIDIHGRTVSLRGNGKIDLSEFAKMYGGGGHPDASGFKLNDDLLKKLLIPKKVI